MTIALCIAFCVAIAIASLVNYLEVRGSNLWAAGVLALVLIAGWSFAIYMSIQDAS